MRVLFIGDIVGAPGRKTLLKLLPVLRRSWAPLDFVIVNGENAAAGRGMTEKISAELFDAGVDAVTSGNHIWDRREFLTVLDQEPRVLRPLNYPKGVPGQGMIHLSKGGRDLVVVNLQGRVFMPTIDCPFQAMDHLLAKWGRLPVFVDFHAEATSEKRVMGHYLDGRVAAIVGTHTHVPTADEEILPGGTAYITDVGMTGAFRGSIGMTYDSVMSRFLTGLPSHFEVAQEDCRLCGVIMDIDDELGRGTDIRRIMLSLEEFEKD